MAEEKVNIAILGAGIWVREEFLPAIASNPRVRLTAIFSRTQSTAESLIASQPSLSASSVTIYTADSARPWTDILTDPQIHGIIVALPIVQQPQYVKAILESGKHLISEKPLSFSSASALELLKTYKNKEVGKGLWGVTEDYRFYSSYATARHELETTLGGVNNVTTFSVHVDSYIDTDNKYYNTPWRKTPEYMGGFLLDGGVHYVSGLRILLGRDNPVVKVSAFAHLKEEHLAPYDSLHAVLQLKSGVSGTFAVSFCTGGNTRETCVSTGEGRVRVTRNSVDLRMRDGSERLIMKDDDGVVGREVEAFVDSIKGGEVDGRLSVEEAWGDLVLLECMLKSAEGGGVVVDVPQEIPY